MAEQESGLGRMTRGAVLVGAAAVLLLAWSAAKITMRGRRPGTVAPVPPPYTRDGSPPWTWPRPVSAGADIWATGQWDARYQPWPPEWMTS